MFRALEIDPFDSVASDGLAAISLQAGSPERASEYAWRAVKADPYLARTWFVLSQTSAAAGRYVLRRALVAALWCWPQWDGQRLCFRRTARREKSV